MEEGRVERTSSIVYIFSKRYPASSICFSQGFLPFRDQSAKFLVLSFKNFQLNYRLLNHLEFSIAHMLTADRQTDRQTDIQTQRQEDKWTDRETDRQISIQRSYILKGAAYTEMRLIRGGGQYGRC